MKIHLHDYQDMRETEICEDYHHFTIGEWVYTPEMLITAVKNYEAMKDHARRRSRKRTEKKQKERALKEQQGK